MSTEYDQQAEQFLARNGLKLRITLSDTKQCPWQEAYKPHYRVTLSKPSSTRAISTDGGRGRENEIVRNRLTFDFWANDANPYSVLACLGSDAFCPDTFEEFCSEYGYEEDSRKALQTFNRASRFADRIRAFFTASEIEELAQIQ